MRQIIRQLSDYYLDKNFRKFQNEFAKEIYDSIGMSYANNYNEVKMVTELCDVIHGKSYNLLKFYSKKIHGTRSYVEFYKLDKPVTTELADMVLISIITRKKEIIYEKISFVQNKKNDESGNWKIDDNQLFLLKNFPTFHGSKGIFKINFKSDVAFNNSTKTLGCYGLFKQPGEMIIANADKIYNLLDGDKVKYSELKALSSDETNNQFGLPFYDKHLWHEIIMNYYDFLPAKGFPFSNLPFFRNTTISHNIYEFIRNWSLFNFGEEVTVNANIIDAELAQFTRLLLRQAGLGDFINLGDNIQGEIDANIIVNVAHLAVQE